MKFNFNKANNHIALKEGFDFNMMDSDDNTSSTFKKAVNSIALCNLNITKVFAKQLSQTEESFSTFKQLYIDEISVNVLYKNVAWTGSNAVKDKIYKLQHDKWPVINQDFQWEICNYLASNRNIDTPEKFMPFYQEHFNNKDEDYIANSFTRHKKFLDAITNDMFLEIYHYLLNHQVKNFDLIELFASPDHGMFALSIYKEYDNENCDIIPKATKSYIVLFGLTNLVDYPESHENTVKVDKSDKARIKGLIKALKPHVPSSVSLTAFENVTLKNGQVAIVSSPGQVDHGKLHAAKRTYSFFNAPDSYKLLKNFNKKFWHNSLTVKSPSELQFPPSIRSYQTNMKNYFSENMYELKDNEIMCFPYFKNMDDYCLISFSVTDFSNDAVRTYLTVLQPDIIFDKNGEVAK